MSPGCRLVRLAEGSFVFEALGHFVRLYLFVKRIVCKHSFGNVVVTYYSCLAQDIGDARRFEFPWICKAGLSVNFGWLLVKEVR
jgi:hypothetical protein